MQDGGKCGFLATTAEQYAAAIAQTFASPDGLLALRKAGRARAPMFSDQVFHEQFMKAVKPLVA